MILIPSNVISTSTEDINKLLLAIPNNYSYLDINIIELKGEILLWKSTSNQNKNEGKNITYNYKL